MDYRCASIKSCIINAYGTYKAICASLHITACLMVAQIVLPLGDEASKRAGKNPKRDSEIYPIEGKKITSQTGEVGIVRRSPDMDSLKSALKVWLAIASHKKRLDPCQAACMLATCMSLLNNSSAICKMLLVLKYCR